MCILQSWQPELLRPAVLLSGADQMQCGAAITLCKVRTSKSQGSTCLSRMM